MPGPAWLPAKATASAHVSNASNAALANAEVTEVSAHQEKLRVSLVKAMDAKRALEADKAELALRVDALEAEVLELRQKAAAGNGAKAAADDGGLGDAWGDDATPCAQQPLATPARPPSIAQSDLLNATQSQGSVGMSQDR